MYAADHKIQHQLEHALWLKELGFLCDEIEIMKRHLGHLYYRENGEEVMRAVADFDEKFCLQKEWLERMKKDLQQYEISDDPHSVDPLVKKSFSLQMQANRIVNEELKDSFLKLFS